MQEPQRAKADYALAKALNKFDRYALLVMHRYERGLLLVTSNQPFSEWENVFSTSAMTVAAAAQYCLMTNGRQRT